MSEDRPHPGRTGRTPRSDARRNRDALLGTAHEVFAEHGTDASLGEIARRSGVSIGTLYRHFPHRDALLEALLHQQLVLLRTTAEELMDSASREALARWFALATEHATTYRGLPGSVAQALRQEGSELYDACHAMGDAARQLVGRAQESGAIRADVEPGDLLALAGAVAWVAEQRPHDSGQSERLLQLVLDAATVRS